LDVNRVMMPATIALPVGSVFELALSDVVTARASIVAKFVGRYDEEDNQRYEIEDHGFP